MGHTKSLFCENNDTFKKTESHIKKKRDMTKYKKKEIKTCVFQSLDLLTV